MYIKIQNNQIQDKVSGSLFAGDVIEMLVINNG